MRFYSDPHNPLVPRIQQHIERMIRSRTEIFDESSRKRAHEPQHDGVDVKRQRMAQQPTNIPSLQIAPLGPGPHSVAEIFTLTPSEGLRNFDVGVVPAGLVSRIIVSTLARIDAQLLGKAIQVRKQLLPPVNAIRPPNIS
jgi:symplekin